MAREQQFKAQDKKTQRMTKDGFVEVNQTTGEQERISPRGAEFQLRQGVPDLETAPLREQPRTGHARQPTQRQTQAFMVDSTSAEGRLDAPSGADFDVQPTDSLPRQASDVPVTGSPGHSSAHTDSGARSYHTEGGRLRENAHLPEAPTPEHRQSGSGYYQQFQETPQVPASEQHFAEPLSQRESPAANTNADSQPSASVEVPDSAIPTAEPPATSRQTDDSPLTPKYATNHAARDAPMDAPLSSDSAGVASLPEHPGRLRFEEGSAPKLRDKQRQSGTKYARKFTQDVEVVTQTTTTDSADHSTPATDSSTSAPDDKLPVHDGSVAPAPDSSTASPPGKKTSRLQFDTEELPPQTALERKIERLQGKIGKTDAKLKKAQEHLPTKRKMRTERSYTDWETELQLHIDNAERDHSGYDEYRYDLEEIGHDPYELLAYLTAKYRDYTFAEVQRELQQIFAEQYTLEFVEEVGNRYYEDENGNEIPYERYIPNINLTTKPLGDILSPRMDTEQTEGLPLRSWGLGSPQQASGVHSALLAVYSATFNEARIT